jgi:hypothetical protein
MFNKSLAFGTVFAGSNIRHYAMHNAPCPDAFPYATAVPGTLKPLHVYHLDMHDSIDMLSSVKAYCNSIASFCNLREVAFEVRQAAVDAANARSAEYQRAGVPLPAFEVSFQGKLATAETAAAEGDKAEEEADNTAEEAEDEEDIEEEDDVAEDEAEDGNADEVEDIKAMGALASPVSRNGNRANNAGNACSSSRT